MRKMNNLLSILAVLALSGTASAALAQAPAQPNAASATCVACHSNIGAMHQGNKHQNCIKKQPYRKRSKKNHR